MSKSEDLRVKREIYKANPGLLAAMTRAQRAGSASVGVDADIEKRGDLQAQLREMLAAMQRGDLQLSPAELRAMQDLLRQFPAAGIGKKLDGLYRVVADQVVKVLGRAPIDKAEETRVRREIYQANPGLLTAITKAERIARAAGADTAAGDALARALASLKEATTAEDYGSLQAGMRAHIEELVAQISGLVGGGAATKSAIRKALAPLEDAARGLDALSATTT
jgi:hypothetical protein